MTARTPEDVDRLFGEHMNAGNLDALLALYEPDASLLDDAGTPATGTAAIRTSLEPLFAMKPRVIMHVTHVVSGGGDVAVLYNDWRATLAGPDGPAEVTGRAIEIVRRQPDGTWRFVIDDPYARSR